MCRYRLVPLLGISADDLALLVVSFLGSAFKYVLHEGLVKRIPISFEERYCELSTPLRASLNMPPRFEIAYCGIMRLSLKGSGG